MSSENIPAASTPGANYTVSSLAERPDLIDLHQMIGGSAWPEFMLHDPVALANWEKLMTHFASDQLSLLIGDQIAAVANMVPIRVADQDSLPDRGVDWGVEKAVFDHENCVRPNAVMGVQVVVAKDFRGRKLSEAAAREMIEHAKRRSLELVLLPVRPNEKHAYPLIPMDEYIRWKTPAGLPFDSWLRVHERLGGKTTSICHQSMIIDGTIEEWQEWTGLTFPGSGRYIAPFALNPIDIDVDRNYGRYTEPNVWVVHRLSK